MDGKPQPQVVVVDRKLAAQLRFAGFARLYAVAALLSPMLLFIQPLTGGTRTYRTIGESIAAGDSYWVAVMLVAYVALLIVATFNPVKRGLGAAIALASLAVACLHALPTSGSDRVLTEAGWAALVLSLGLAVLGSVHEARVTRAWARHEL